MLSIHKPADVVAGHRGITDLNFTTERGIECRMKPGGDSWIWKRWRIGVLHACVDRLFARVGSMLMEEDDRVYLRNTKII